MRNQIEIVKDIADGMYGIGGLPNNEEFYAEFDMRVKSALGIHDVVGRSEQLVAFLKWVGDGYDFENNAEKIVKEYTDEGN